jgi:hypothetical protein
MSPDQKSDILNAVISATGIVAVFAVAAFAFVAEAQQQPRSRTNPLLTPGVRAALAAKDLAPVESFSSIPDQAARSVALFIEASKVIEHPRCMNCHPVTRKPVQGDDMHPHVPPITSPAATHAAGVPCGSCHGKDNRPTGSAGIRSVPGAEHWALAPQSMGWQTLTTGQICEQIKDPARNGNRDLQKIITHMTEDHLVGWAWHPGLGRTAAPGTQQRFGSLIAAWVETGAHCPQ